MKPPKIDIHRALKFFVEQEVLNDLGAHNIKTLCHWYKGHEPRFKLIDAHVSWGWKLGLSEI